MLKALFLLLPLATMAADPAGFAVWRSSELKGMEKKLAAKVDAQKISGEGLAKYDNHSLSLSHREGSGIAELHKTVADIFVIQSGGATIVVGGTIPNANDTAPGEVRGPKVQGGSRHVVAAGDVVHIPANTPHQMLLDAGTQVTYFVVKVNETK